MIMNVTCNLLFSSTCIKNFLGGSVYITFQKNCLILKGESRIIRVLSCSKPMIIVKNAKRKWPSVLVCLVIPHTIKCHQRSTNDQNNSPNKTPCVKTTFASGLYPFCCRIFLFIISRLSCCFLVCFGRSCINVYN